MVSPGFPVNEASSAMWPPEDVPSIAMREGSVLYCVAC